MATNPPLKIQQLLDRAASDPALLQRLAADPLGTAKAEGVDIDARHIKAMLGMPDVSDQEIVDVLRSRVSHAATACNPFIHFRPYC